MGEDERENTKVQGTDSYPLGERGGRRAGSLSDPCTAIALFLNEEFERRIFERRSIIETYRWKLAKIRISAVNCEYGKYKYF